MERNYSIEFLRGLAAFGIVGCHLALTPMTESALQLRALCDMNVCLFAALSGYLMAEGEIRNGSGKEGFAEWWNYVCKRTKRLIPTYIVWTLVYVLVGFVFDYLFRHQLNPKYHNPGFILNVIFCGSSATHLWFLICLFYAQIVFKFLRVVFNRISGWVWLAIGFALILWASHDSCWMEKYLVRLTAALVAGFGLRMVRDRIGKFGRMWLWGVTIVCIVVHYVLKPVCPVFIRDWVLSVLLLLTVATAHLPPQMNSLAALLGKTSMGVFLVHPVFAVAGGLVVKHFATSPYSVLAEGLDWVFVWLASFITTLLILRIPKLGTIVK